MALILTARTVPFSKGEILGILASDYFHFFRWTPSNKLHADFKSHALRQIKNGFHMPDMANGVWPKDMLIRHMETEGMHLASYLAPENAGKSFEESSEGMAIIQKIETTKFPVRLKSAIRVLNTLIKEIQP